jgi:hypothetical protein
MERAANVDISLSKIISGEPTPVNVQRANLLFLNVSVLIL